MKEAQKEKEFLLSLATNARKVNIIPAETLEIAKAMRSGEYDCLHFSGHGVACRREPNRSEILLENNDVLYPEDISGAICNLGKSRALVFFNACQTGRGALSLTHAGGWAARFINAGAAVFIGTHWSVLDDSAHKFCEVFYKNIISGADMGQAARKARLSIRNSGDPTWLSYTVFSDPVAYLRQ